MANCSSLFKFIVLNLPAPQITAYVKWATCDIYITMINRPQVQIYCFKVTLESSMRVRTSSGMYDMIQDLDQFEGVVIILGCGYNGRCNLPNFNRLKL